MKSIFFFFISLAGKLNLLQGEVSAALDRGQEDSGELRVSELDCCRESQNILLVVTL